MTRTSAFEKETTNYIVIVDRVYCLTCDDYTVTTVHRFDPELKYRSDRLSCRCIRCGDVEADSGTDARGPFEGFSREAWIVAHSKHR